MLILFYHFSCRANRLLGQCAYYYKQYVTGVGGDADVTVDWKLTPALSKMEVSSWMLVG